MELDLSQLSQGVRYKLLTSLVIPRPIAWVTTNNEDGSCNAAPYSFFNVLGNEPPIIAFGPGFRPDGTLKDTLRNIERERVFVINMVDRTLTEAMHQSAAPFAPGDSETQALGIATEPAATVDVPRIAASKVHLECRLWDILHIEGNRVVIGTVLHMQVAEGLLEPETYHIRKGAFDAVGRLQGPGQYTTCREQFDLGRFPAPKK